MEWTTEVITNQILVMLALILFSGVIFSKLSEILHLPDVVLFILAGILMGPSVLKLIDVTRYPIGNNIILTLGSAYILYDGGREINLKVLNKVKISVALLATMGVLISSLIMGLSIMKIFNISLITALLAGVVIASTDPAVLIPLFKKVNIKEKIKQTIISESAFNDAATAIATFSIINIITTNKFSLNYSIMQLLQSAGVGLLVGCLMGVISTFLLSEKSYGFLMEHPSKVVLGTVCASYTIASRLGGSGYMAVFVAGIIFGNKELLGVSHSELHETTHTHFKEVLSDIFRIMIFILLGTQINFHILFQNLKFDLIVVAILIFVARPISVLFCLMLDKKSNWNFKEVIYLMWIRETGVIPAALSGMIVSMNLPNAQIISSITFMTIIITLTLQASTANYLARVLKLDKND